MVCGFIEYHKLRLLRNRSCDEHTLFLATRQAAKPSLSELRHSYLVKCVGYDTLIFGVIRLKKPLVWVAAHCDDFPDSEIKGNFTVLADHGNLCRPLPRG